MSSNGDLLWWVSRGSGLAALVALTLGLAFGIDTLWRPSFVGAGLHRALSVTGLALVVVHVGAVVLDGYAPVGWLDAVVPFRSGYRILWTGLGSLGFDLMLLAAVTSARAVRRRIGHRSWRAVHLLSWLCWPVSVAHGLATGTDTRAVWALVLTLACVALVSGLLGARVAGRRRWVAWPAAVAGVAVTLTLTAAGPASADWASRAGTPRGLGGTAGRISAGAGSSAGSGGAWRARLTRELGGPGLAVRGVVSEQLEPDAATERARQVFTAALPGGSLTLVLEGPAYETGLVLASSAVSLGPTGAPAAFRGAVVGAAASSYTLLVTGPGTGAAGWRLHLVADLDGPVAWHGRLRVG